MSVAQTAPREEALAILRFAHSNWPHHPEIAARYGEILLGERNYVEADRVLNACVSGDHRYRAACEVGRAVALLHLRRADEAADILQRPATSALAQGAYSPALCWLVHARIDLGDLASATHLLEQALVLARGRESRALLHLESGRLALLNGNGSAALAAAGAAIDIDPRPEYELVRAVTYAWLGRFREASEATARITDGGLPAHTRNIPRLLRAAVEVGSSESPFLVQVQSYPTEQMGWFCLAMFHHQRHNDDNAQAALQRGREQALSMTLLTPPWVRQE